MAEHIGEKNAEGKKSSELKKTVAKKAAKVVFLGVGAGMLGIAGITMRDHRELTHENLQLSKRLQRLFDFEQRSLGVREPYTWASVHIGHHRWEDGTLYPEYRIYHAMKEAEARGIDIPDTFPHLDPFVKKMPRDAVEKIGEMADQEIQSRMKDQYQAPTFATNEEIIATLHPTAPQYFYPERIKREAKTDYTADDVARMLLSDPHSPALVQRENGVQGVAMQNMSMYKEHASMFRTFPEFKPEHLQRKEDFDPEYQAKEKNRTRLAVAAGFAVPAAAMFLLNRDYSAKGLAVAVTEGAAINGVRAGLEITGGNVTNSAGHMGDPVQTELAKAFLNRVYEIKLKPDGTISTNTVGKGIVGRAASWATLDEVGGQQVHHLEPWKIAYTDETGIKAVIEAPWGSGLQFLAESHAFRDINLGNQFAGAERPDVAHPAIKMIQALRVAQNDIEPERGSFPQSGGLSRFGRRITGFSRSGK